MKIGRPIEFNWDGKFLEADATIENYRLYLSTFPGGSYTIFYRFGLLGELKYYKFIMIRLEMNAKSFKLFGLSTLSVPDECYSINASCILYLISIVFIPQSMAY